MNWEEGEDAVTMKTPKIKLWRENGDWLGKSRSMNGAERVGIGTLPAVLVWILWAKQTKGLIAYGANHEV